MSATSRSALGADRSVRTSGYLATGDARGGAAPGRSPEGLTAPAPGQVFMDLLLLGALACQAPVAVLSVPQPDGRWNALTYGTETREGVNDGQLYEMFVAGSEAMEISDLVTALPRSPFVQPPHSMRWAYGVALRDESGAVLGVVAVLDRWLRQLTKREQRAVASMGRQLGVQLAGLRRSGTFTGASGETEPGPGGADPGAGAGARPGGIGGERSGPNEPAEGSATAAASFLTLPVPPGEHEPVRPVSRDLPGRRAPVGGMGAAGGPLASERHPLLRSQEVAELFDVTERTVINWAAAGKLPCLRTIGGHLRFRREDVLRLLTGSGG